MKVWRASEGFRADSFQTFLTFLTVRRCDSFLGQAKNEDLKEQ